jgi:hypothetical protein
MSPRSKRPGGNPVLIAFAGLFLAVALMCVVAATAHASYYKMVLCAANNGSNGFQTATNTASSQNPGGIFSFENYCGPAPFPAGDNAFLRIAENQSGGSAGDTAYGSMSWTTVPWVDIVAGGGYTREPNAFNDGWRGRFWLEGWDGSTNNVLMQGSGVENGSCGGVCWGTTPVFASHLWPFGSYGKYRRFVFELTCFRQAGCDRTNFNAVDANTMILTLNDVDNSHISLTNTGTGILSGQWVRGSQNVTWDVSDQGSGMRFERLRVDGGERYSIDWRENCNIDSNGAIGEFARDFQPCPTGGPWGRSYSMDTAAFSDGAHAVQVCSQDYGQSQGLGGSGSESCDQRTIHTDNNPPGAPLGLSITTPNPNRYESQLGASWNLPADPGSPVTKVHYAITDASGKNDVVPEKVVGGVNPKELGTIGAPVAPDGYRLRVWLEDQVGLVGPAAVVPIPHDTTPPAAPEDVSVAAPKTPRSSQGFDVSWRNVSDAGAPINAAHYQILDGKDEVVVPTQDVVGDNPQSIADLATPRERGVYTLRLWLTDAEGNASQPVTAPLAFDCLRSDIGGGHSLTAGLGTKSKDRLAVRQGQGGRFAGRLSVKGDGLADVPLCVFSRIVTKHHKRFLGIAVTGREGRFTFAVEPGPSRDLIAVYRPNHRELRARATLRTKVRPTLRLLNGTVHNRGRPAVFKGRIPGPNAAGVTVLLQVEDGKGWRVYRQGLTGPNGRFVMHYGFKKTYSATTYTMRARVNKQRGYAYEPGVSKKIKVPVLP